MKAAAAIRRLCCPLRFLQSLLARVSTVRAVTACLSLVCFCAALAATAGASTIAFNIGTSGLPGTFVTTYSNVDFDNNGSGDVWNNFSGIGAGTYGSLQDLAGNVLPDVTIRYIDYPTGFVSNNTSAPTTAQWNNALDVEQVKANNGILSSETYDYTGNKLITLNIEGLGVGTRWTVEVFAVEANSATGDQYVTINGAVSQLVNSDLYFTSGNPEDGRAVFYDVPASLADDGTISVDVSSSVTALLSAVRLTQSVPEPASLAVAAFGLVGLLLVRRR